MFPIRIFRIYDDVPQDEGVRLLVDRLWPRGIAKEKANWDRWFKTIAPSDNLRRWFHHDPTRWTEFNRLYRAELDAAPEAVGELLALCHDEPIILLTAARDTEHNQALVLRDYLQERGAQT